jgi:D-alanine--poly(phosphoribitol) ligase subunit 1
MAFELLKQLYSSFRNYPDNEAFCFNNVLYSYAKVEAKTAGILSQIKAKNSADDLIGVITGSDAETYCSILAILFNGSGYVPVYHHHPKDRVVEIIKDSGIKLLLVAGEWEHSKTVEEQCDCKVLRIGSKGSISQLTIPEIDAEQLAYLFYTSGSTGRPKGVPVSHRNINAFFDSLFSEHTFRFDERDRHLQMFELTFDLSVMSFFTPLSTGGCCFIVPAEGVSYLNIYRILTEQSITVALMVPSVLSYLQPHFEEIDLPALKTSLFCGEALPTHLIEAWDKCAPNAKLFNVYGPTEATIFCTVQQVTATALNEAENGIVPIGKSVSGVQVYITNENGIPAEDGTKGELCLAGNQVVKSYWNNTEKNKEAFITIDNELAYCTGDLAYVNTSGNLIFCGRLDTQLKINGFRVELGEIEFHAAQIQGIRQLAAVNIENQLGKPSIHLFVEKGTVDIETIKAHLKQHLPPYMLPDKIHFVEDIPHNTNGKIDRPGLKKRVVTV